MTDPTVYPIEVTYREGEAKRLEVGTRRWEGDHSYAQTYTFKMEGSAASLVGIEPDGESYNVPGNAGTREAAADAVRDLPFVQAVSMFDTEV